MKKTVSRSRLFAAICLAFALVVSPADAQVAPKRPQLPNVDKRLEDAGKPAEIPAAKRAAVENLRNRIAGANVNVDPILKSPGYISSTRGFLTGPDGVGRGVSADAARGIAQDDPHRPVKTFLNEHAQAFGHDAEILSAAKVNRDFVTEHSGMKTIVWQQELDGIPVYEALLIGHITKRGELVNLSARFLPDLAKAANAGKANRQAGQKAETISAAEAIISAAKDVGSDLALDQIKEVGAPEGAIQKQKFNAAPVLKGETFAELVWLPMSDSEMRLCWQVLFTSGARSEMFKSIVDAQTGEVVIRHGLTEHISDATYNVYTSDSPSPFSPGHQFPDVTQPALVPRVLVTTPALSVNASPNGWINDGDTETLGNNVHAHLDRDDDNVPDLPRPNGGTGRVFDFPLNLTQPPTTYGDAAVVNLFYWNNWMHDRLYDLGFTEAAGNFQTDNFGRGGIGGDHVLADAQDGINLNDPFHDNNANMATPPDGFSPRMQMYKFSGPNPDRDGDLDAEVILHEYTHGLSNRRVGGGVGMSALQSRGMGEGWSDFYGLALLSEPNDDVNAAYAMGGYLTLNFFGLQENYYFGIRRYPYTTDMSKNPLTFKDIDPAQASAHPGIPISPVSGGPADGVHKQGEVWCVTLWEARALLIQKYGYAIGNQLILRLVTDGMNLSPANPTFLQARDGILLADQVLTGGVNQNELWAAFAKRGMGALAGSPASTTTAGVIESFDVPGLALSAINLSGGNGNGLVDFNECNNLQIVLTNIGVDASNITVQLTTTTPEVIIAQPFSTYPNIPGGGSAANFTPFKVSTSPFFVCGTPVELTLVIKSDIDTRTNFFRLSSGVTGTSVRYDNNTPVQIPDANPIGATSAIIVTNFTGTLGKVAVSLHITHTFVFDLQLELIAPDGTSVILSQNNGGSGDNYGAGCFPEGSRTRFDEAATLAISAANPPFIGMFQPDQPLSNFNLKSGTNVNGIWQLKVTDQIPIDVGAIQCWSLFLSPQTCTDGGGECPGSDLGVSMVALPAPAVSGSNLVYTITVTNDGPSTAKGVVLSHILPDGAIFVSATNSQGTVQQAGGTVTCNLGIINARRSATVTVVVIPTTQGIISSTAAVGSSEADPDPSNNSVTVFTQVVPPSADLAVTIVDAPDPVSAGGQLTYTITVTNRGPTAANNVMVTNTLPSTAAFVSANSTQGTFVNAGGTIIYNLGTLTNGAGATITIVVRPTVVGSITMTSRVVSDQADLVPGNNVASASTTVSPAADIALSIVDTPDPVVSGSNITYVITVTNRGPNTATTVTINGVLPNTNVVSAIISQGTYTNSGTSFTASIGTLFSGSSATLTIQIVSPVVALGQTQTLTLTATASAGQADPNLADNSAIATTLVAPPFVSVAPAGALLTAESFSPANGSVDPGETVSVVLRLRNAGNINTTNLVATLQATGGVTSSSAQQTYGVLAAGGSPVEKTFSFTANGSAGDTITATLQLRDGGAPFTNVTFTFALPTVREFANTNGIIIPDSGTANPYPSQITVSGVTGLVDKVTVTLNKINHTYPDDIDILLVDPTGRKVLIMSDAGGGNHLNGVVLTLDSAAETALADFDQLVSGNFRPANYQPVGEPDDFFPSAPTGPYETSLDLFDGTSPNGTWSLYVVDDTGGDSGNISGGWSLSITTISPVNQVVDLTVTTTASASAVLLNEQITYTITVANAGPDVANNVTVSNPLPPNTTPLTPTSFDLGSLAAGSNAVVTVTLIPNAVGLLTNTAIVSANEIDLNKLNNTNSAITSVGLPVADLGIAIAASTPTPIVGNNFTYTITVTNNGPDNALNVVVTNRLPATTAFVSASSSQGTVSNSSGVVTCAIGNIGAGNLVTISITAAPLSVGSITNNANVITGSNDPNGGNNSASLTSIAANPAPNIVASGSSLVSESLLANGVIDPGETVQISFALANVGTADTANLVATLQATGGISPSTSQNYGVVAFGGAAVARTFTFTLAPGHIGTITATLQLQDGANNLGTATFSFDLPALTGAANTAAISIPNSGPATPYPATITISNATGVISKVTVSLHGLTHSFPDDLDIVLVSPGGQKTILMSDVGGSHSISNVNLTFDDSSASALSDTAKVQSGTYRPTDFESGESLPPPAPGGPYPVSFASFAGGQPNGTWSLYINDDTAGDSGFISGGWSLTITTVNTINPAAGLSVSVATPGSAFTGDNVSYTITVSNSGPATATGVVLTDVLPANFTFGSAVLSQGTHSVVGQTVTCNLGFLNVNAKATVTLTGTPTFAGTITNNAVATANETDLYLANNSVQTTTSISAATVAWLGSASVTEEGNFKLTLHGQPGLSYRVDASTDLGAWIPVTTNVAGGDGKFHFTDTAATNFNPRFYRAVRLP